MRRKQGIDAPVDDDFTAVIAMLGDCDGFIQGRAAVVQGGVGVVHPGNARDHGLVFKYGAECPLGGLRLVGRIGCIEFRSRRKRYSPLTG